MANIINNFSNSKGSNFKDYFNITSENVYATFRSLEVGETQVIKFAAGKKVGRPGLDVIYILI